MIKPKYANGFMRDPDQPTQIQGWWFSPEGFEREARDIFEAGRDAYVGGLDGNNLQCTTLDQAWEEFKKERKK